MSDPKFKRGDVVKFQTSKFNSFIGIIGSHVGFNHFTILCENKENDYCKSSDEIQSMNLNVFDMIKEK